MVTTEVFAAEIKRLHELINEREKQSHLALDVVRESIEKMEADAERFHVSSNEWRAAMNDREQKFVRREEYGLLQSEVVYLRRGIDENRGRRVAWIAAAGIIATLLAIGVGQILRGNMSASDVSQQITREAPWNKDKASVQRRITILEAQSARQQIAIARLQSDLRAHALLDARR